MKRFLICLAALFAATFVSADEPKVAERWAVLIGVDDYAYAQKLKYCGADQRAFRDRLITSGFPADHVFLLHDKADDPRFRPSQRNIERQLNLVLNLADAEDLVVVAFSGHGVHLDGKSFLCPGDCTLDDAATLISVDGVYDRLKACAAEFKLVVVDACRNDPRRGGSRSMTATDGTRALARSLQELKLPEGVVLLNSCAPGEVSWEDEKLGHGVFMHFVLDAMGGPADANADGAVSLLELQSYAGSRTKTYVANQYSEIQRPFFKGDLTTEALEYALLPVKPSVATVAPNVSPKTTSPSGSAIPYSSQPRDVITNSIGMKFTLIPAGEFLMGSPDSDADAHKSEKPQHRVRITKPFLIGIHEVTQGQWQAVMGTTPWNNKEFVQQEEKNYVKEGADHPAIFVSWNDAKEFCRKLSAKEGKTYDLPTEAQWEYACRAGTTTRFSFSDESRFGDYAWEDKDIPQFDYETAHAVGVKRPNPWGLYDMHSNVWEWCNDFCDDQYYGVSPVDDPAGLSSGHVHVYRGGGWGNSTKFSRSSSRSAGDSDHRELYLGFRVALAP